MQSLASLFLFFAVGFGLALAGSCVAALLARRGRSTQVPKVGAKVRIRTGAGVYRSRIRSNDGSTWRVATPVQRDRYVPMREGEEVVIEAAGSKGVLLFRSRVLGEEADAGSLAIQRPDRIHYVERRSARRYPALAGSLGKLEGTEARLMDVSEGGARVCSSARVSKGDRVELELPWGDVLYGWVLSHEGEESRIRFEEPLVVEARNRGKRETAPVF